MTQARAALRECEAELAQVRAERDDLAKQASKLLDERKELLAAIERWQKAQSVSAEEPVDEAEDNLYAVKRRIKGERNG